MDKKYYELAKLVNDKIQNDPRYAPSVRSTAYDILSYKKKNIVSWYLIYLKGLCNILGMKDMEEFQPLLEVDGIKIHYCINPQEAMIASHAASKFMYYNEYDVDEVKYVRGILKEFESHGGKPLRVVSYGKVFWVLPDAEPKQESSLLEKIDESESERKENL